MTNDQAAVGYAKQIIHYERLLLEVLVEIDRNREYEKFGFTYLTPYCVKRLGLSLDVAKCFVRIVRKSHFVPELAESVVKGHVCLYSARAIASSITPENKQEWIEKAKKKSKAELEREVAAANGKDRVTQKLDLLIETRDKLERVREVMSTKKAAYQSLEEVIDALADEYLQKNDPVEKAERGRGTTLKHQIVKRDEDRCQFIYEDGSQCEERKWIHFHHIQARSEGGPDTLENLISLCSGHHRIVHKTH